MYDMGPEVGQVLSLLALLSVEGSMKVDSKTHLQALLHSDTASRIP